MALSARQQAFKDYYLADANLNAYQAALKAGFAESTAKSRSHEWVCENKEDCPDVYHELWDAINKAKAERAERCQVDADYVLERLIEIDEMDLLDIMYDDMTVRPLSEWPKCWRRTISGLDIMELASAGKDTQALIKKIKWPDKVKNIELLGKHIGVQAFKEKVEAEHSFNLIQEMADFAEVNQDSPLPVRKV